MYFVRTPTILKKLFSRFIWEFPTAENQFFLTFDDGPHPEITPWILNELDKYNAKATFFCLGENAVKYPEIIRKIIEDGHAIGSHGQAHLDGWKVSKAQYEQNILLGKSTLENYTQQEINLFRPPYGKFKHQVSAKQITIMWSLMVGDFDNAVSDEKCLKRLLAAKSGDIIVLHDNEKSWKHLQASLPVFLSEFQQCKFEKIIL